MMSKLLNWLFGSSDDKGHTDPLVSGKFQYVLTWFSKEDELEVGRLELPSLKPETVRSWFGLSDNEPPIYCYPVTINQRNYLLEFTDSIDLQEYDYFVEGEAIN